jgi:hypothetical protein
MTLGTALSFRFDFCAAAMEVIGALRVFQNPTIIIFARRVAPGCNYAAVGLAV